MEDTPTATDPWFRFFPRRGNAELRLFCFPYAGGGPNVFRSWGERLPDDVEIAAVVLPGHHDRIGEPSHSEWSSLLDVTESAISRYLEKPFIFFGHSFGARLAFELTKRLQARRLPLPTRLFVSGCRCPHIPAAKPFMHELPRAEFYARVLKLGGISPEAVKSETLMKIFEPALRADVRLSELWSSTDHQVEVPIITFGGLKDDIAPPHNMREWARYTGAHFSSYTFPEDHFFLHKNEKEMLNVMSLLINR